MKIENLLCFLGNSIDDVRTREVLNTEGVDVSNLVLPSGEFNVYLEFKNAGLSFVFTDSAWFLGLNRSLGQSGLFFTGIFVYAEGKDGYTQSDQILPLSLSFLMTSGELISKLGQSSWKRLRPDVTPVAFRWDNLEKYRIHITFEKQTDKPVVFFFGVPEKSL